LKDAPSVCVLGAGPAGLLAAWGAVKEGVGTLVIGDRDTSYRPGRIFSLQYLHDPCGLEFAARRIHLHYDVDPSPVLLETSLQYAYNRKLGRPDDEENSTRFLFESPVNVWSLKDAYYWLYRSLATAMIQDEVDFDRILNICENYDLVISTIPLDLLFPHMEWPVRETLITPGFAPLVIPRNTCLYNLEPTVPWYRITHLDGGLSAEWISKGDYDPDVFQKLRKVVKAPKYPPLPNNLVLAGRWGTWDPKALTHDAYQIARRAVREIRERTV